METKFNPETMGYEVTEDLEPLRLGLIKSIGSNLAHERDKFISDQLQKLGWAPPERVRQFENTCKTVMEAVELRDYDAAHMAAWTALNEPEN